MQELDQILAQLLESVDGALSVAVGGMDGLLIEQYPPERRDLSVVAAEKTNILVNIRSAYGQTLSGGELREVIVTTEKLVGYTRLLGDGLFCLIIMNASGNIGKARLYSDQAVQRITEVLT